MPYVEVKINLDEFSDQELVDELQRRKLEHDSGPDMETIQEIVGKIYSKRKFGLDFLKEVDDLIYNVVGRIV